MLYIIFTKYGCFLKKLPAKNKESKFPTFRLSNSGRKRDIKDALDRHIEEQLLNKDTEDSSRDIDNAVNCGMTMLIITSIHLLSVIISTIISCLSVFIRM